MPHTRIAPTPSLRVTFKYARSWLLVSANTSDLFGQVASSPADVVLLDLEDAVVADAKSQARSRAAELLCSGRRAWIRINDASSAFWADDLTELGGLPGVDGVMLAKTEHGEQIDATAARLPAGMPIVALIESAAGIEAASDIAYRPATSRLAFGSGDFRRDTGMSDDPLAMSYPRTRLTVASRVAHLPGPIDGPTLSSDPDVLARDTAMAASMGMTGRLCLRPTQAGTVNGELSPSSDDIVWAKAVLERLASIGTGVRDGSDLPRLARAQKILELARIYS